MLGLGFWVWYDGDCFLCVGVESVEDNFEGVIVWWLWFVFFENVICGMKCGRGIFLRRGG